MLKINRQLYEALRRHGEQTYPHECCGVLLGQADNGVRIVTSIARCGNTRDDSPYNRYNIDPHSGTKAKNTHHRDTEAQRAPAFPL